MRFYLWNLKFTSNFPYTASTLFLLQSGPVPCKVQQCYGIFCMQRCQLCTCCKKCRSHMWDKMHVRIS